MSEVLLPTTRAQVSGHRFLRRRVEHALVLGDLRMIHDPLARRQRALLFGVVAMVMIGLGAGLLALVRPAADPGQAAILRADSGALFVRVEERLHPVHNLASARLVAGEAADPAKISDEVLLSHQLGAPVGLIDAPAVLPAAPPGEVGWAVCEDVSAQRLGVVAGVRPENLGEEEAVLVESSGASYLLNTEGRFRLPDPDSREGRVIRRALGITSDTPRWEPRPEVLEVAVAGPDFAVPAEARRVLLAAELAWLETPSGLVQLSEVQSRILGDLGTPVEEVPRELVADHPDAPDPPPLNLPERRYTWVDPAAGPLCLSGERGHPGRLAELPGAVELPGVSVAQFYAGPVTGTLAVDTGSGYRVVSESGLVHPVPDPEVFGVLGLSPEQVSAPWPILKLLPQGTVLDPVAARRIQFPGPSAEGVGES
ncbi:ESX-1 secretion system protein eccB1 [Corynebacterium occultum]|uniref:ESX-1 secretion system protein eccB1 n=1 Tax=Corynebacterium occultum TaxID=2675219 RepID=A0A6B8VQQ4_9CORY|nr:type VII secretion protein EccB [Corynebacterium occultum]QGU06463.1 ESX-1 secretion system protein eccB1 [Corynebacterium occultum]